MWNDAASAADAYLIESGNELFAANSEEGESRLTVSILTMEMRRMLSIMRRGTGGSIAARSMTMLSGKCCKNFYALSKTQPQKVRIRSKYLSSDELPNEKGFAIFGF